MSRWIVTSWIVLLKHLKLFFEFIFTVIYNNKCFLVLFMYEIYGLCKDLVIKDFFLTPIVFYYEKALVVLLFLLNV